MLLPSTRSRGDDAIPQNALVVIDVADEGVQRGHALPHAAFQHIPFPRGQHARDQIEGQYAVDRVLVGIHRESDTLIVELGLGDGGAAAQLGRVHAGQALRDQGHAGVVCRAIHELAEERPAIVPIQQPVRR